MDHWSEIYLQQLYDSVLVHSALEFRSALHSLSEGRSGRRRAVYDSAHVREIRRGLRAMLNELERRGVFLPSAERPVTT